MTDYARIWMVEKIKTGAAHERTSISCPAEAVASERARHARPGSRALLMGIATGQELTGDPIG